MWNEIQLIGRFVKDPDRKKVSSYDLAQFTLVQNKGTGDKQIAMYYDCKAWGKSCDKSMQFKKGDLVIIRGRLDQETWTKQDGTRGSKHVVNVNMMMLIPKTDKLNADPSEGIYPAVEVDYSGPAEAIF